MKAVKAILQLLLVLVVTIYMIWAAIHSTRQVNHEVCKDLCVQIKDSATYGFITAVDADHLLNVNNLNPRGMSRADIDLQRIEQAISKHPAVKRVKCYISPSGILHVDIYQRRPIFRVMGLQSYFVDDEGKRMPLFADNAVYVPIVTGSVEEDDIESLCDFVRFLQKDEFWDAQVEQIDLSPQKEVELTTRVGDQQLLLGRLDGYEAKLRKMRTVYVGALVDMDWNAYKKFDLRYKGQVIGIK